MRGKSYNLFRDSKFWEDQWKEKAARYLKGKPVLGMIIEDLIENNLLTDVENICEIAAGSARDSVYLSKKYSVIATDKYTAGFKIAAEFAEKNKSNIIFQQEDAYNFTFPDNHFDLVFHNGFFILFPENEKILKLLKEQIRISRKYVMIVVHNKWDLYSRLRIKHYAKKDPLFEFRWWNLRELKLLVKPFGKIIHSGGLEVAIIRVFQNYQLLPQFIKKMKIWEWKAWKKLLPCERIYLIIEKSHMI